jgi:hypothetical protein
LLSIEVILRHSAIKGRQRNHLTAHQSNTGFNELSLLAMCLRIPPTWRDLRKGNSGKGKLVFSGSVETSITSERGAGARGREWRNCGRAWRPVHCDMSGTDIRGREQREGAVPE